jgi:hypothetical protein
MALTKYSKLYVSSLVAYQLRQPSAQLPQMHRRHFSSKCFGSTYTLSSMVEPFLCPPSLDTCFLGQNQPEAVACEMTTNRNIPSKDHKLSCEKNWNRNHIETQFHATRKLSPTSNHDQFRKILMLASVNHAGIGKFGNSESAPSKKSPDSKPKSNKPLQMRCTGFLHAVSRNSTKPTIQ